MLTKQQAVDLYLEATAEERAKTEARLTELITSACKVWDRGVEFYMDDEGFNYYITSEVLFDAGYAFNRIAKEGKWVFQIEW